MAQWKNKEEYEKWKAERAKKAKEVPKEMPQVSERADIEKGGKASDDLLINKINPNYLGIAGALLTGVGVFLPFLKLPIIGSINYYMNGRGDGSFVLVLSVVSLLLIFFNKIKWIFIPSVAAGVPFVYSLYKIKFVTEDLDLPDLPESNPFNGMADAITETLAASIQIEIGAFIIFLGITFQLISFLLYRRKLQK